MRPNKMRELLNAQKPTLGTRVHSIWPAVVEIIGHTGVFDYVEFVAEYAPFDLAGLDDFCRAAELHDLGTMIKVDRAGCDFYASRAVGAGFQSILFTDARCAEDVREYVRIVRPDTPEHGGTYGVSTRRMSYMGYGGTQDYVRAVGNVVVAVMLEKKGALDELDEILSIPGVEMVQWGPADFSMSIGRPGERDHADVKAAEQRIIDTCLRQGVIPRIEIETPDQAKRYLDMGVRHFNLSTDVSILYKWWKSNGEEMRRALEG